MSIPRRARTPWWKWPTIVWWRSLPLRVISSVFLASVLVLVLGGFLLMQRATIGVLDGKREAAESDARQAVSTAQQQLDAADLTGGVDVDKILVDLATSFANRSSRWTVRDDHPCAWADRHGRAGRHIQHSCEPSRAS